MDDDNPPDTDELGNDPETARRSRSPEELAALDASLGITTVRVGLDEALFEALKARAADDGVTLASVYRAAISRYLTRHGGREAGSSASDRILGDVEPGEGAVECEFRVASDDFLALVDLAQR